MTYSWWCCGQKAGWVYGGVLQAEILMRVAHYANQQMRYPAAQYKIHYPDRVNVGKSVGKTKQAS
jgi:hypothetical protein